MSTLFLEFELSAGWLTKLLVTSTLVSGTVLVWCSLTTHAGLLPSEYMYDFLTKGVVLVLVALVAFILWLHDINTRMREEGN